MNFTARFASDRLSEQRLVMAGMRPRDIQRH